MPFDVAALFTLVDLDLTKKITKKLLQGHYSGKPLETQAVYELQDMCPHTCFRLNGNVYELIKGTPTGSPIKESLTEAITQVLENIALPKIQ